MSASGAKKKGKEYRLHSESGDAAFLTFSPTLIDPDALVFFVQCLFVPEPYWEWLNRSHVDAGIPPADTSGALAAYSVMPPDSCAHAPAATGLARARWAFGGRNRAAVGAALAGQLEAKELPRIGRLLERPGLLEEITSSQSPSVRRWGAVQSELVLMVDDYTAQQKEILLGATELDDAFRQGYREWEGVRGRRSR
ncbi:hypothetical protein ACFU6I_21870 [Streptomyces sp. NPDC057486]|uniref:hypothetical protein n=1 Tax=Streptomyces sp. NPDC057486 TaxID=3346145 RepID=UPI0036A1E158